LVLFLFLRPSGDVEPGETPEKVPRSQTLQDCIFRNQKYAASDPKQRQFDKAVIQFIVQDMRPFSVVEGKGFERLIHVADPRLTVKHRTTYSREKLPRLYEENQQKFIKVLEKHKESLLSVAVTTDLWTSRSGDPFMCLTLHYIADDYKYCSWVADCSYFSGSHTGDAIKERMEHEIEKFELNANVDVFSTHDNGANVVCAMNNSPSMTQNFRCICHTMQLCIHDSFNGTDGMLNAVQKCKKLASYVHYSSLASQALETECDKLKVKYKKIIQACPTRWNSELMNMQSVYELKDAIMSLTRKKEFHELAPNPREWDMIEGGVMILQKFRIASELWSADTQPTLHLVVPMLYDLLGHLKSFNKDRNSYGKGRMFIKELLKNMEKRFPSCYSDNDYYCVANLLDPRFQGVQIDSFGRLEQAKLFLRNQVSEVEEDMNDSRASETTEESEATASELLLKKKKKQDTNIRFPEHPLDKEFAIYLAMPLMSSKASGTEILEWWQQQESALPNLSKFVRKYYAIPASSASSERTFSASGNCVSPKRTSLDTDTVSMLVFLNKNMSKLS
jgi:hypothetical protein